MQLHDNHAKSIGVDLEKVKLIMIVTATLTTAACVSFVGLVGFVGLICPHAVRLMWSKDYRILVPASAIIGAAFLIFSDTFLNRIFSFLKRYHIVSDKFASKILNLFK